MNLITRNLGVFIVSVLTAPGVYLLFLSPGRLNLTNNLQIPVTITPLEKPHTPSSTVSSEFNSSLTVSSGTAQYKTISPTPTVFLAVSVIKTTTITSTPTEQLSPSPAVTFTPSPIPITVTGSDLDNWFTLYAGLYSVDRDSLVRVAMCETKLNPLARNGIYGGLFQFSENTWNSTRTMMNLDTNPDLRFNAQESIRTAAFKISTSGLSAWPNCK